MLGFFGIDFFSTELRDGKPASDKARVVYVKIKPDKKENLRRIIDFII